MAPAKRKINQPSGTSMQALDMNEEDESLAASEMMESLAKRAKVEPTSESSGDTPAQPPAQGEDAPPPAHEELQNDVLQQSGISEQEEALKALPVTMDAVDMSQFDRLEERRALIINVDDMAYFSGRIAARAGLKVTNPIVYEALAAGLQERLRTILESLIVIRNHRNDDITKRGQFSVVKSHPRKQLTLLERNAKEVARLKEEKDDAEQARSRDKEAKAKLQKKKEAEEELQKTRRANTTMAHMLNMPTKSWMVQDATGAPASPGGAGSPAASPLPGTAAARPMGPGRLQAAGGASRISLPDMLHFMELDLNTRHSKRIYRAYLRQGAP